MNSEDKIMQVENPQLVGREQIAVYVPVDEILDGMANDPDERFKGPQGKTGEAGADGVDGADGKDGVGVESVVQTVTSDTDAGTNVITVTLTNGAKATFNVKNGSRGSQGIQGIQGETGKGFSISKTYSSVEEMREGFDIDGVPLNGFVLINTGDVDDEDNAKLFVKSENGYSYLTDLSGAQGIKGEQGVSITGVTLTEEKGLDFTMSNGDHLYTASVQGPAGISITSVTIDSNSHLKVTLSNGTTLDAGEIETGGGGTKTTVGGIEVSEWNADTKLDKITSTAGRVRIYGVDKSGNQKMYYASNAVGGNQTDEIITRGSQGQVYVRSKPTANNEAVSKQYVDDKFKSLSNTTSIPRLQDITNSVTVDSIQTVPTLSFPYSTFHPTALDSVYPFIIGKLIFFIDDMYLVSIDIPFGGGMYGATVYVNDPLTPQTGTVAITEDSEGTSFKMTDEEGTFVQDMINILEDGETHYMQIFTQY